VGTDATPVTFGLGSEQEMCIDFLYYYPYNAAIKTHCTIGHGGHFGGAYDGNTPITSDSDPGMRVFGVNVGTPDDPTCTGGAVVEVPAPTTAAPTTAAPTTAAPATAGATATTAAATTAAATTSTSTTAAPPAAASTTAAPTSTAAPSTPTPAPPAAPSPAERAAATTRVSTTITLAGMTEQQFTLHKGSVTAALASTFGVHASLIRVAIDSSSSRRRLLDDAVSPLVSPKPIVTSAAAPRALSSTDVKLTVELFVAPGAAAAMESTVTQVKSNPAALASAVEAETSIAVTPTLTVPAETAGQTPPAAPPAPTESPDRGVSNSAAARGATALAIGMAAVVAAVQLAWL
jgi:hypothetical protein